MPKREPVARPAKKNDYLIFLDGYGVEKGWRECVSQLANAMADAWDRLTTEPGVETERQYQLSGDLAEKTVDGTKLPQWQYKISDGGRIRYVIDATPVKNDRGRVQNAGRVIVVDASPGHPKDTEKRRGRR